MKIDEEWVDVAVELGHAADAVSAGIIHVPSTEEFVMVYVTILFRIFSTSDR